MSSLIKNIWIFGLLISCPFGESKENCPLNQFRELSVDGKRELVDSFSEENINTALVYHQNCLRKREKNIA